MRTGLEEIHFMSGEKYASPALSNSVDELGDAGKDDCLARILHGAVAGAGGVRDSDGRRRDWLVPNVPPCRQTLLAPPPRLKSREILDVFSSFPR